MVIGIMVALLAVCLYLGIDQIFSIGWAGGAANTVTSALTFTGDTSVLVEFTLGTGAITDQEQTFAILKAGIKALEIVVTGNALATVTCETNSSSAPSDTWVFPIGGGRLIWDSTFPSSSPAIIANPLTANITTTFWTKSATVDTPTVTVRCLYNS